MRSVENSNNDPSPSRFLYRLHRLWLTPLFRGFIRYVTPLFLIAIFGISYFSKVENIDILKVSWREFQENTKNRPEFLIKFVKISGVNQTLGNEIRTSMGLDLPVSSYDIDLLEIETQIALIKEVKNVDVYVAENIVHVQIQERKPAIYWLNENGLELLDTEGVSIRSVENDQVKLDLPLIAGVGARVSLDEAFFIYDSCKIFLMEILGLVRVGERRWDIILDNNRKIMLPADNLELAVKKLIMENNEKKLLLFDFSVLDLRNPKRIIIRNKKDTEKIVEIKLRKLVEGEIS